MLPVLDMNVALKVPVSLNATVSPLPAVWPAPKLMVEVAGLDLGWGPRYRAQPSDGLTTVTFPVTATALSGMPSRPETLNVAGTPATSLAG